VTDVATKDLFGVAGDEDGIRGLASEQPEGQLLDFKTAPPPKDRHEPRRQWKDSIAKAACAFANASGGLVLVGVGDDQPRQLKPFADAITVAEEINRHLTTQIDPDPSSTRVVHVPSAQAGRGYVCVLAPSSLEAPHMFAGEFPRRRGEESFPMTRSEIADMFGRRLRPHFQLSTLGYLTQDSSPRFDFALTLQNTGGGSADRPAVVADRAEGSPGKIGVDGRFWTSTRRADGCDVFRSTGDTLLHPGEQQPLLRWEVPAATTMVRPWRLDLTIYSADTSPQRLSLVVDEAFVETVRRHPATWVPMPLGPTP
jgi:hypothetical protein